jgi:hypothetical protein
MSSKRFLQPILGRDAGPSTGRRDCVRVRTHNRSQRCPKGRRLDIRSLRPCRFDIETCLRSRALPTPDHVAPQRFDHGVPPSIHIQSATTAIHAQLHEVSAARLRPSVEACAAWIRVSPCAQFSPSFRQVPSDIILACGANSAKLRPATRAQSGWAAMDMLGYRYLAATRGRT